MIVIKVGNYCLIALIAFCYIAVAPEITVPNQLYGVGPGTDVTVKCKVEAHPSAINYWMKDDNEMLLDGPKYQITER
jgi:hypothetical protein